MAKKKKKQPSSKSEHQKKFPLFRLFLATGVLVFTFWMAGMLNYKGETLLNVVDREIGSELLQPLHDKIFSKNKKQPDEIDRILDDVEKARKEKKSAVKTVKPQPKPRPKPIQARPVPKKATPQRQQPNPPTQQQTESPSPAPAPPVDHIDYRDRQRLDDIIDQVSE